MRIRRPRRLIGVAAGGLAALGIAGIAAENAIDPAAYRDTLERRASAAAGRAVTVDGAIDLAPGLQPRLILRDVRVANAEWASTDALLRAERVAVDVALLPLLWGDVQLRRLALDAPRLNLATGPVGMLLAMMGRERVLLLIATFEMALLASLGLALIPVLGLEGAAIATSATLAARNIATWVLAIRLLGINPTMGRYRAPSTS